MTVDTGPIISQLNDNRDLFDEYSLRREGGSPHAQMTDIWVRYNDIKPYLKSNDYSTFADEHDSIWYPCAKKLPAAKKIIFDVMSKVRGERLGGGLITSLPAGNEITPHTDSGWHAAYYDKYYVAVQNKKGSSFFFDDGVIEPNQGEVWQFDNSHLHWVKNESDQERISMIICIKRST